MTRFNVQVRYLRDLRLLWEDIPQVTIEYNGVDEAQTQLQRIVDASNSVLEIRYAVDGSTQGHYVSPAPDFSESRRNRAIRLCQHVERMESLAAPPLVFDSTVVNEAQRLVALVGDDFNQVRTMKVSGNAQPQAVKLVVNRYGVTEIKRALGVTANNIILTAIRTGVLVEVKQEANQVTVYRLHESVRV